MAHKKTISKRNPVARNPLLRKGGAHQPPRGEVRPGSKSLLDEALSEWEEAHKDDIPEQD